MNQQGTIITFYSYKGGTGRSMTLANIACLMSRRFAGSSKRVLMIDFDLEAPGLHDFFSKVSEKAREDRPGVLNYFNDLDRCFKAKKSLYKSASGMDGQALEDAAPIGEYIISDVMSNLDMMKAGKFDASYSELVTSFDWFAFYQNHGESIQAVKALLTGRYEFILIDSRTGLTDTSGICTMLLPEKIVGVFTPNRQSIDGLLTLVRQAVEYRRSSDDFRPLTVFPLPSRIDIEEPRRRQEWRNDYQDKFEALFMELYGLKACSLAEYFDEVQLPHSKYYAYGEEIAVLVEERQESLSLSRAYQNFFVRLIELDFAWQTFGEKASIESAVPEKQARVFISYASEDYPVAKKLYHDLKKAGVRPWLDREDLQQNQSWQLNILKEMREGDFLLLLISDHSVSEEGFIQDQQKSILKIFEALSHDQFFILPVRLDGTTPKDDFLGKLIWADLIDYDNGLKKIIKMLLHHEKIFNS